MESSSGFEFLDVHPFIRPTVLDRVRGTIFGGALGDSVGLYTEFLSKDLSREAYPEGRFRLVEPTTKFRNDSHRNKFNETSWTDDTDHALLIILSYLHRHGNAEFELDLDPRDFAARLRYWCEQGLRCLNRLPLGLGKTVGRVVCDKEFLHEPMETAYRHWKKFSSTSASNGSLMRTHPLGIMCLGMTLDETFQVAANFSRITHADPRCIVSCCLVTALIRGLLRGEIAQEKDLGAMITQSVTWVEAWMAQENQSKPSTEASPDLYDAFDRAEFEKHVLCEELVALQLDDSLKMGYVYKALGAGILSLRHAFQRLDHQTIQGQESIFEDLITALVLEGGDADTNSAVAGSLLGALLGYKELPSVWRDGLESKEWLLSKCNGLASTMKIYTFSPAYSGSEDHDTEVQGGKPTLSREELYRREHQFMERYLGKSLPQPGEKSKISVWMDKLRHK